MSEKFGCPFIKVQYCHFIGQTKRGWFARNKRRTPSCGNFTNRRAYTNSIYSTIGAVGSLTNEAGGQITNDGTFYNSKSTSDSSVTLTNNSSITNNSGKSIDNYILLQLS